MTGSGEMESCEEPSATKLYVKGFQSQRGGQPHQAIDHYQKCLSIESTCIPCSYELGWSFWSISDWESVVKVWEPIEDTEFYPELKTYLNQAIDKKQIADGQQSKFVQQNVPIGIESKPESASVRLKLIARFQQYNRKPQNKNDHFDIDIFSPKSVAFTLDGKKAYVNSLEGFKTVIYDVEKLKKIKTISHRFDDNQSNLFQESAPFNYFYHDRKSKDFNPNVFSGKPVEATFSHNGRYLWTPYYRRNFDETGVDPSAIAIIDTIKDEIVRVISTGPISKYVEPSPNGKWMAVSHWGDNSISLIAIDSPDPRRFVNVAHLHVEKPLSIEDMKGDRDKNCGFCLRGMTFSKDSKYLFVARMKGGGIAVFRIKQSGGTYLGTIFGFKPTPRDLHMSADGIWLYLSSNLSGYVTRVKTKTLVKQALEAKGKHVTLTKNKFNFLEKQIGAGVRSIRLAFKDKLLFAAVNLESKLVAMDADELNVIATIPVDSYPVGLDVNTERSQVWVTSQGRSRNGGNSVSIYEIDR